MIEEDYEPYPDDGDGKGDYPWLKPSSGDSRSGLIDWDLPEMKRNFNEPLPLHYDATTEQRFDDTTVTPISDSQAWIFFIGIFGSFMAMYYVGTLYPSFQPVAEHQLPYKNTHKGQGEVKKFYTFELE